MEALALIALIWIVVGTILTCWTCGGAIAAAWREPVLKRPVLIVESDDWGAGPLEQAEWLKRIAAVFDTFADCDGKKPVMTLGLVLGVPYGTRISADGLCKYHRKLLDDPELAPVLAAIKHGIQLGVFSPQLHGHEHFWPPTLLRAARSDPHVEAWLVAKGLAKTEALPAALQSRWVDASVLPSRPLPVAELKCAALAEAEDFRRILGAGPSVAVPPTFIWNDEVEISWAEGGVRFVVTPGQRYEARNADGEPSANGSAFVNGDRGRGGVMYLVRDVYFEPARGHKVVHALRAIRIKTHAGRPTLLETHRANFLGDEAAAAEAVRELERLLRMAIQAFPELAFLSTEELANRMHEKDPRLVEHRFAARLNVCMRRLWRLGRLRKLACITGAIVPAWLLYTVSRPATPRAPRG